MNPHQLPVVAMEIGDETVQTVDARRLHAFLEVGRAFGAWLPERIKSYGFVEGADYVVFSQTGNNPKVGRPTKEYAVSIDMAKELAMVERNDKGKEARRYFIACEKAMKERVTVTQGITADDVRLLVAEAIKAASGVEMAKAREYEVQTVVTNGITIKELVNNLNLPAGVSRSSVAQQLKSRLVRHYALADLPAVQECGIWRFGRVNSGELSRKWRTEMIAVAIQRVRRAPDKRQNELKLVVPSTGA